MVIHVALALSALAMSAAANFSPSDNKLRTSYGLAVATLASGGLLIFVNHANVLRTCLTGIVFFGIVSILNELARKHLATQRER
ncbi:hypothetical protein E6P97_01345 [Patescibacteria group bacterium]|nr:MAG: hypothetical protein E6P97_01345 [Patescibacteria group bacterium]